MRANAKEKKITFIISLLLHLLLLSIFAFYGFKNASERKKLKLSALAQKRLMQRLQNSKTQSRLLPKFSEKGTHVIFDNRTLEQEKERPREEIRQVAQAVPEKEDKKEEKKKIEKTEKIEPKNKKVLKKVAQKTQKIKNLKKLILAKKVEKKMEKIEKQEKIEKKELVKKIEQVKLPKIHAQQTQPASKQKKVRTNQKKKKSLLSLMKTYLDHDQGNSCMIREGANKFPDLAEMKYICYEKKIEEHTLSTWRSLNYKPRRVVKGKVCISFLINKNGDVIEAEITGSSGDRIFDNAVLTCIKQTKYPPIPKHFGTDTYRPQGGLLILPN